MFMCLQEFYDENYENTLESIREMIETYGIRHTISTVVPPTYEDVHKGSIPYAFNTLIDVLVSSQLEDDFVDHLAYQMDKDKCSF